ncbi:hypothetical protein B5F40_14430 [Gordonibacter sp. An230]|uniref:dimethyl sulfoxide reductase anchor subunit family protein n=1 Tax=Gordonibacter sp. An230 TaxID=1965592 RepID=UPI000B38B22E|nr:hypothetical protein [Gordonibacter sp. An230]OUO86992.1 hypothetical protein B5F40_14430 [Gordonibacter sp. An230]
MELQWPLIIFTTLVAWSAGVFGAQGALAIGGHARRSQMPLLATSVVLLAVSGVAVFFHLEHWERIFNGFGHLSSGITQEFIVIMVFAAVAVTYFAMLRRSGDGTVPKWAAWLAVVVSVVLVAVCAHSYVMAARPAWDSVLEVLSLVGASLLMGPAMCGAVMGLRGDDASALGLPAVAAAAAGALLIAAFAVFLQVSAGSFVDVGYYFDPTSPTAGMAGAASVAAIQAPLLWGGAVALGGVAPFAAVLAAWRSGSWRLWGPAAVACALVGAVCLRVVFYELGLSVFMFY